MVFSYKLNLKYKRISFNTSIFFEDLLHALTVKSVFLRMLWNSEVGMDLKLSQTPLKLSPQRFRWAVLSAFA